METVLVVCGIVIIALGAFSLWMLRANRLEREARISSEAKLSHLESCEVDLAEQRQEVVRLVQLSSELEGKSARLADLERETASLNLRFGEASTEAVALRTKLAERERAHVQEIAALTAIREDIEKNLKVLAAESLKENQHHFFNSQTRPLISIKREPQQNLVSGRRRLAHCLSQ
jgi:predicted nuclease with TOPRIM domain